MLLGCIIAGVAQRSEANPSETEAASKTALLREPWFGSLRYRGYDWETLARKLPESSTLRDLFLKLDESVSKVLADGTDYYRRPASVVEIPKALLDPIYLQAGGNGETFALAMADCGQGDYLRRNGVLLAVFARLFNREDCLAKCVDMLEAFCGHKPLQRPGWTAYTPEARLPSGGDGVWLGTAWGIQGISEMLWILGDRVPPKLRSDLRLLLKEEALRITEDWRLQRPWYVKSGEFQSNQWIEPSVGLIRACLIAQDADLVPAYNLGVENLAKTFSRLGGDGAFVEGVNYASMTTGSLFEGLSLVRANGDTRLDVFPFTTKFWQWWLQMLFAGQQFVNCNDSRMSQIPPWALRTPLPSIYWATSVGGGEDALRQLKWFFPEGNETLFGIQYQAAVENLAATPPQLSHYASFSTQALVVWRSSWERPSNPSTAWSLWIRGGSSLDSHSHRDQGHVSIQRGNVPILLDCGTPDYSTADFDRKYAQAAGHNVFQFQELLPRGTPTDCPVSITKLGGDGGKLSVDCHNAFPATQSYHRYVTWESLGAVQITDEVQLKASLPPGTEIFRFHTGATEPLSVTKVESGHVIQWPSARITIRSDPAVVIEQATWPDATLPPFHHQVIIIRLGDSSDKVRLVTDIQPVDPQ